MAAGKTNWKGKNCTGRKKRKKEDFEWLLDLGNNFKGRAQIQNRPWFQPRHKRITNHRMEPQGKIKDMKPKFNNPRQSPSFNSRANNYLQQILRKPGEGRFPHRWLGLTQNRGRNFTSKPRQGMVQTPTPTSNGGEAH